jgi:hypothetical protein
MTNRATVCFTRGCQILEVTIAVGRSDIFRGHWIKRLITLTRSWFMLDHFLICFKLYCCLRWDMLLCWVKRKYSRPPITTVFTHLISLSETCYMFWHFSCSHRQLSKYRRQAFYVQKHYWLKRTEFFSVFLNSVLLMLVKTEVKVNIFKVY